MNRIEDERIKFWLEHQARIREWAGLEAEVRKFADRFYCSLKSDLDAALRSGRLADDDVEPLDRHLHEHRGYRGLGLRRHDWPDGDEDPDVRLEWHSERVCFSDGDHLICGVRTAVDSYKQPFAKERRPNYPDQNAVWWPAFTHVDPPAGRFWEDDNLREYRDRLIEIIVEAWKYLAPLVDEAVGRPAPLTDVDEAGGPRGNGRA